MLLALVSAYAPIGGRGGWCSFSDVSNSFPNWRCVNAFRFVVNCCTVNFRLLSCTVQVSRATGALSTCPSLLEAGWLGWTGWLAGLGEGGVIFFFENLKYLQKEATGSFEKWFSVYIIRVTLPHGTIKIWRGFFVFVIYLFWLAGLGWLAGWLG